MEEERRTRVLVVDDDAPNVRTFLRVFRELYDVRTALSGAEALELLRSCPVDVALVDYSMPAMNGLEILRELERSFPKVVRVLLTGYGDHPDILAAQRAGLVTVLSKPWDRDEVERTVEQLLAARDARG